MIERRKPLYSPAFAGLASACACASFVFLLGGGPYDMIGAFVGAGLGQRNGHMMADALRGAGNDGLLSGQAEAIDD
jgi:uncharacterized membrane protein YjjP (DUF1212 family)